MGQGKLQKIMARIVYQLSRTLCTSNMSNVMIIAETPSDMPCTSPTVSTFPRTPDRAGSRSAATMKTPSLDFPTRRAITYFISGCTAIPWSSLVSIRARCRKEDALPCWRSESRELWSKPTSGPGSSHTTACGVQARLCSRPFLLCMLRTLSVRRDRLCRPALLQPMRYARTARRIRGDSDDI
jgi:hypothetical protein